MLSVENEDFERILRDYGIAAKIQSVLELQRYNYERNGPDTKEVRLIVRMDLEDGTSLVIRFKNEQDVTVALIESQCAFAERLRQNGISTPLQYRSEGCFARQYAIGGYDVIVTVEQFVENEIKLVNASIAQKTGELLAKTHSIAEKEKLLVPNGVLFNPFTDNDLFDYEAFLTIGPGLERENKVLFAQIADKYHAYMDILAPLKERPAYAVQGDISDCNLYLTHSGEIGLFDYNRSGNNILFCDAVMQAVFEARLMDYPENCGADNERVILQAFLEGYTSVRPFSEQEMEWFPYLHAIIDAFWSSDIRWDDHSLLHMQEAGDRQGVSRRLKTIWDRLCHVKSK